VPATIAAVTATPRSRQGPPGWASARPPRACLDLGAIPTAPRCARAWTREILWEWGAAGLADAAELVASELVTNSVNACAGLDQAAIRLILTFDQGELAVLVRDDHPDVPMAAQPGADDESGRGLLIVEHLSDRCGWYPVKGAEPAKVTWAVISRAGQAAGDLFAEPYPGVGRAATARAVPVLPARHRRPPLVPAGMRGPRTVDPDILARVKAALERL
jgi:anti-sigma regulatory factor (Ser/Thr protein kinase)